MAAACVDRIASGFAISKKWGEKQRVSIQVCNGSDPPIRPPNHTHSRLSHLCLHKEELNQAAGRPTFDLAGAGIDDHLDDVALIIDPLSNFERHPIEGGVPHGDWYVFHLGPLQRVLAFKLA